MKLKELIDTLENQGFSIGNIRESIFYKKEKDKHVKMGIYGRLSKADKKVIVRQMRALENIALYEFNIPIEDIKKYVDNGFSGTNDKRPKYLEMLRDLNKNDINVIFTTHIDRFGRAVEQVINNIYPRGITEHLYIAFDNKLINSPDNIGKIKEIAIAADKYAEDFGNKSRRGIYSQMRNGSVISAKELYGYKIEFDEDEGIRKIVIGDEYKVNVVKDIFEMYLTGKSLNDIKSYLEHKKIKSPSGNEKWSKGTIVSILSNPLYTGHLYQRRYKKLNYTYSGEGNRIVKLPKKEWINGGQFKGIIDEKVFNCIQQMLEENKSSRSSGENRYAFTGVLKCGECGKALVYRKQSKGYKCSSSQQKGDIKCTTHFIKEDELYEIVSEKILNKLLQNRDYIRDKVEQKIISDGLMKNKIDSKNRIVKEKENALSKLADIYLKIDEIKYGDEVVKKMEKKIELLNRDEEVIDSEINYINSRIGAEKEVLYNIEKYIKKENWIIKLFIKRITIYEENRISIEWRC